MPSAKSPLVWLLGAAAVANLAVAAVLIKTVYVGRAVKEPSLAVPDFAAFWAAARMALEGRAPAAWDWEAHKAAEIAALGFEFPGWMPWTYPPFFQLLVSPFGAMPVWVAMALWVAATLALFLRVGWQILPGPVSVLICLATGPTLMVLFNGQTGFLTAALAGYALLHHAERPGRAGLSLSVLAIKPQLGLAFPVLLAAGGYWRAFVWAAAGVAGLVVLSGVVLGPDTWSAFLGAFGRTAETFSGDGLDPKWKMFASVYGWCRLAGLDTVPSLMVHAVPALIGLAMAVQAWRQADADPAVRSAMACYATVLVTPRVLTYDLGILVMGALFQLRAARTTGPAPGEFTVIAVALLTLSISVIMAPGPSPLAAPMLLAMCWYARVRPARTIRIGVS